MFKLFFFTALNIIMSTFLLFSCSSKVRKAENTDNQDNIQKEYILKGSLSLNDYSSTNGYFPKDGFVSTPEIAIQIAETILNGIYGKKNIEKQKPFFINLENDVWIIEGKIENDVKGGVAYMEIRKSNGEILKVIHGK